jgi:hypothetical protein
MEWIIPKKRLRMLTLMAGPNSDRAISNVQYMFFHKWAEIASETVTVDCDPELD